MDGVCYLKLIDDSPFVVDPFNIVEPVNRSGLGDLIERIPNLPLSFIKKKYGTIKEEAYSNKDNPSESKDKYQKASEELISLYTDAEENGKQLTIFEYWVQREELMCEIYIANENLTSDYELITDEWKLESAILVDKFVSPIKDQHGKPTLPYSKAHNIFVENRRGGFSVFETVKGVQEYYNELINMEGEGNSLNLKNIYLYKKGRKSKKITDKFVQTINSGGVIPLNSDETLERLPFNYVNNVVLNNTNNAFNLGKQIAGVSSTDVGEKLPSRVSATAVKYAQNSSETSYGATLENMSILLCDFVERLWMPAILAKLSKESEPMEILGKRDDFMAYDKFLIEADLFSEMNKIYETLGFYGYRDSSNNVQRIYEDFEIDDIVSQRMESNEFKQNVRTIRIVKEMFNSLKYDISFEIGAERSRKQQKIQNIMQLLSLVGDNIKGKITLVQELAELLEIDQSLFDPTIQEKEAIKMQQTKKQADSSPNIVQQNTTGNPIDPELNSPNM